MSGTAGKKAERGWEEKQRQGEGEEGDREPVGDLSLQIVTTETFLNRM